MAPARAVLLAHQGGWDEILFVAGPVAVIVVLLAIAQRRVSRAAPAEAPAGDADQARSTSAPSPRNRPTKSS